LITHCDLQAPKEEDIAAKLASFKQHGEVDCPRANVILFNNKAASLNGFVAKLATINSQSSMTFDLPNVTAAAKQVSS
jgi:hypothetical protein